MARIEFKNDLDKKLEELEGSDGRINTSSRSDTRSYYISRDEGLSFSLPFDFQSAAAGEFGVYWRNDSQTNDLVIDAIGVNSAENARLKLWFVSGTAAGGTSLTPTNLNRTSSKSAEATAMEGGSAASGITGLSPDALIDFAYCQANGHEEFRLRDRVRLGQNDAIAIEYDEGTDGDMSGVIFGFYEPTRR